MNVLKHSVNRVLNENEDYETFCEKYKMAHDNLISDLKTFSDSVEHPILVPVCNRVLMRGKLIHTNEIMVSLGCGYFTKCSSSEAQRICLRRINRADTILQELEKERNFVHGQMKFSEENVFSTGCQEIIEAYDETAEKNWRNSHALRMKEYKLKESKELVTVDHEELMNKLELLELQEEIEELHAKEEAKSIQAPLIKSNQTVEDKIRIQNTTEETREFVLRKKLADLRQRKKSKCNTEEDIFRRLKELEEEEEIEDELDRLYDNIYGGNENKVTDSQGSSNSESVEDDYYDSGDATDDENKLREPSKDEDKNTIKSRKVSFNTELQIDSKTATINFSHSDNPSYEKRDSTIITSPSDIYKMFPENSKKEVKSILKNIQRVEQHNTNFSNDTSATTDMSADIIEHDERSSRDTNLTQQIVFGNIVEHSKNETELVTKKNIENQKRPISKFKSMRIANKQSK